ncbi:MAG: MoaD/ThiS family protein [Bacteroidetes bacterium]|nr:MoaD/ThiS family protein [Bacteroidota bacterium]
MQINILIFGQLADIIGENKIDLWDIPDTEALKMYLQKRYPGLSDLPYLIAVDKEVISANTVLNNNSEVALLPPYAGG